MTKKILIGAVIFFFIALGVGYYLIFMKSPVGEPIAVNTPNMPFGQGSPNANLANRNVTPSGQGQAVEMAALTHLSLEPISGATFVETKASTTVVRFAERATSHISDVNLASGLVSRSSVTTIPKIYESIWFNNGSSLVLRGLDDTQSISSYIAKIVPSATTSPDAAGELLGSYLPSDIDTMAVAPSAKRIFYMIPTAAGTRGFIANSDKTKPANIFSSPANEWLVSWPQENIITLTTKASASAKGLLYFLSPTGGVQKVLGNIFGLTTQTDPTGSLVAYSDSSNKLSILNVKTKQSAPAAVKTLAEKCVWSASIKNILYCAAPGNISQGNYPDDWYQGAVSFADNIYKIDAATGTTTMVGSLIGRFGKKLDAINLSLSKNDGYLLFTDKTDLTPWVLKLTK